MGLLPLHFNGHVKIPGNVPHCRNARSSGRGSRGACLSRANFGILWAFGFRLSFCLLIAFS